MVEEVETSTFLLKSRKSIYARMFIPEYGDPVGKWFDRLMSSLGLIDPRFVSHGLRHGGLAKRSAGVPVNSTESQKSYRRRITRTKGTKLHSAEAPDLRP